MHKITTEMISKIDIDIDSDRSREDEISFDEGHISVLANHYKATIIVSIDKEDMPNDLLDSNSFELNIKGDLYQKEFNAIYTVIAGVEGTNDINSSEILNDILFTNVVLDDTMYDYIFVELLEASDNYCDYYYDNNIVDTYENKIF